MKPFCMLMAVLFCCLLLPLAGAEESIEPDPATVTYVDLGPKKLKLSQVKKTLDQYPNLEKVDMFATPVDYKAVDELEARYPGVEFGWTLKIGDHLVRTDATAFSTLHLSGSATHGQKEISLFRYCKQLRALDFGHNGCNDLSFLSELTELRVLIFGINRVTDITPLENLTKLEYLEMFTNHVTDLSPLKGLTHLMDLNISFNDIEDFSPLYEMPWLKRLWLFNSYHRNSRTPVPQEVIDTLLEKLPNTEIDYTHNPTAGTWRTHPHFDVIHAMFRSEEGYVPFADSWPEE